MDDRDRVLYSDINMTVVYKVLVCWQWQGRIAAMGLLSTEARPERPMTYFYACPKSNDLFLAASPQKI